MNLFKGLIKCKSCGHNFNYKNDHGQHYYICSGYKNYGAKYCPRNVIYEDDLIKLIKLHLKHTDKLSILNRGDIEENIDKIEVDKELITIFYKDESKSEWNKNKLIV